MKFPRATLLVVLCRNERQARRAYRLLEQILGRMDLRLNEYKTQIVDLRRGREGFDFLGFHCRRTESYRWPGKWYLTTWPRKKAMKVLRGKVRALTGRRTLSWSVERLLSRMNPILRGWGNYFKYGSSSASFSAIDSYVTRRLSIWLSRKHSRKPWGWQRWQSFIRRLLLVRLGRTAAWMSA